MTNVNAMYTKIGGEWYKSAVAKTSIPLYANLYDTDQDCGSLIVANVYNGTIGQAPSAYIINNPDDTHSVPYSITMYFYTASTGTGLWVSGYAAITATDATDGTTRSVGQTASGGVSGTGQSKTTTFTGNITIKRTEILSATAVTAGSKSGGCSITSQSYTGNNVYIGPVE